MVRTEAFGMLMRLGEWSARERKTHAHLNTHMQCIGNGSGQKKKRKTTTTTTTRDSEKEEASSSVDLSFAWSRWLKFVINYTPIGCGHGIACNDGILAISAQPKLIDVCIRNMCIITIKIFKLYSPPQLRYTMKEIKIGMHSISHCQRCICLGLFVFAIWFCCCWLIPI